MKLSGKWLQNVLRQVSQCQNMAIIKMEAKHMAEKHKMTDEERRRAVVERMWLHYFNNGLLEKGLITEAEHRRMKLYITTRKPSAMER